MTEATPSSQRESSVDSEPASPRAMGRSASDGGTTGFSNALDFCRPIDVAVAMQPPLATVDARDSLDDVFTDLSGANAAVLVGDGGRPAAILTRSDLLEFLAHRRTEVS